MPIRDPMHPALAGAATLIVTLTGCMLYARPILHELGKLRIENNEQSLRIQLLQQSNTALQKRLAKIVARDTACMHGRDAERRARVAPAALFAQLTNNTVPAKRRPLNGERLKALRAKHRMRLAARKEKLRAAATSSAGGKDDVGAFGGKKQLHAKAPAAATGGRRRLFARADHAVDVAVVDGAQR